MDSHRRSEDMWSLFGDFWALWPDFWPTLGLFSENYLLKLLLVWDWQKHCAVNFFLHNFPFNDRLFDFSGVCGLLAARRMVRSELAQMEATTLQAARCIYHLCKSMHWKTIKSKINRWRWGTLVSASLSNLLGVMKEIPKQRRPSPCRLINHRFNTPQLNTDHDTD